jgi:2-phospho-L-lactate/phosphoenolpyruvate guanylyltransferase
VASVVVPFRAGSAKRRLEALDDDSRSALAHLMLADVLAAATVVGPTFVVTEQDAEQARALAASHGANVVDDPGGGQGAAVEAGLAAVTDWPVLVVNADLPEVQPRDLLGLLGAMPEAGIALAPARDGTTNALALAKPGLFEPLYGPGSAARFRAHAEERGIDVAEFDAPALALDVDTVAELEQFAR